MEENKAKLRELAEFVAHIDDNGYTSHDVQQAIAKAEAALAAPARNCDVFAPEVLFNEFINEMPEEVEKKITKRERDLIELTAKGVIDTLLAPYDPAEEVGGKKMSEHKTHAEIIARMRSDAEEDEYTPDGILGQTLHSLADSLEAAHRSEIDELRKQVGNMEKLRESLKIARRFVDASTRVSGRDLLVSDGTHEPYVLTPQDALEKIDSALADPPRNCDCYGTADDSRAAWIGLNIGAQKRYEDFEAWLFAKAEWVMGKDSDNKVKEENEVKPEAVEVPRLSTCPRCGKDSAWIVHPTFDGGAYVSCHECHFSPQGETWDETDAGAAIKWNNLQREGFAQ